MPCPILTLTEGHCQLQWPEILDANPGLWWGRHRVAADPEVAKVLAEVNANPSVYDDFSRLSRSWCRLGGISGPFVCLLPGETDRYGVVQLLSGLLNLSL